MHLLRVIVFVLAWLWLPVGAEESVKEAPASSTGASATGEKLRALIKTMGNDKAATVQIHASGDAEKAEPAAKAAPAAASPSTATPAPAPAPTIRRPITANDYFAARAAAHRSEEAGSSTDPLVSGKKPAAGKTEKAVSGHAHWSYDGPTGPIFWSTLAPENQLCGSGQRQSPIDIQDQDTLPIEAMEALTFDYHPSKGSVINNGHTVQFDFSSDNFLTVRGSRYKLVQFHFHHPSEERINGKGFAMVAHLVHRNDAGQLAVVAVLFEPGAANSEVQTVWSHMPLEVEDRVQLTNDTLDPALLLPKDGRYYQFFGSLTTPPCSEEVLWMVLKQPMTLSAQQIAVFAKLFPVNARPIQALHGRIIKSAQ